MRNDKDEINPFSREYTASHSSSTTTGGEPSRPRPRSGRSFLVWLIPLLLAMIVLPLICCGGILFFGVSRTISEPLDAAVLAIEADGPIAAKLGTPIKRTSKFGVSSYQYQNGNGSAQVDFNIEGPDGKARVRGDMKLFAGEWSPKDLTITCRDGTEFKLPPTVDVQPRTSF